VLYGERYGKITTGYERAFASENAHGSQEGEYAQKSREDFKFLHSKRRTTTNPEIVLR